VSEMSDCEARAPGWGPGCFGWSQRYADGGVVVHVAGELDLSTSAELRQRLMKVVESGRGAVVLDLSDVRFIDAHSVGLIVAACAAARCRGRRLEVDGLRGIPARVFGLLELEPLLAHRTSEDSARRDARGRHERAKPAVRRRFGGGAHGAD
jgi:anti-sigma B factor antagonist